MLSIQHRSFNISVPAIKILSRHKSFESDHVSWSSGGKEMPKSWRHKLEYWYRNPPHLIHPHKMDPNDPDQKYPLQHPDGGIEYFNFTYYPRTPAQVDPVVEKQPVFLVYQICPTVHRPYWEKDILARIGITRERRHAVCKNIPEVNAMLWQVKHLVKITPIKFPKNMPKDANPLHFFIEENGEVRYNPSIKTEEKDLEEVEAPGSFDRKWINEKTREKYHNSLDLEF